MSIDREELKDLVSKSVKWGEPRSVKTERAFMIVRSAAPTGAFWKLWQEHKKELYQLGISVKWNSYLIQWEVQWWEPDPKAEDEIEASKAVSSDIDIPAPPGLEYMPFQKAAIKYSLSRKATLFADEMGLGKTVEAIGRINADPSIKSVLVVCPASLKINWHRELSRWLVREMTIGIEDRNGFPDTDIAIINYNVLKKHKDKIHARAWDCLIVDECHYIKNERAERTKHTMAINARIKLFLTGTPIVNRPTELWPIVKCLDPDDLGKSWFKYHVTYCGARKTRYGFQVGGASNLQKLQAILRKNIMIRRLKKDVMEELPPKRRTIRELSREGAETLLEYQDQLDKATKTETNRLTALIEKAKAEGREEDYIKAVQTLKNHQKIAFAAMMKVRHKLALAKVPHVVEYIREIMEENEEYQLVVFAHHRDVIEKIRHDLEKHNITVVTLTGNDGADKRQEAVDRFQRGEAQVFIGNIQAAGTGITLTASSHVIFAELDWVPANIIQAEDRCHRIGQKDSVLVEHLVFDRSLDVDMVKTLIQKQAIIEQALNPQEEGDLTVESHK